MALTFVASAPIITTANTVNNSNSTVATEINKSGNCSYVNGGPMDASLADEEKIIAVFGILLLLFVLIVGIQIAYTDTLTADTTEGEVMDRLDQSEQAE